MQWYNEPPRWAVRGKTISVTSGAKTDFWRKTHYGFVRDNGHFYCEAITGDFVSEVKVIGQYQALYDQAGLMVRVDETTWLKCGIEFVEGVQHVSAVVTRDFSDWSVVPLAQQPDGLWLRVTRQGEAITVDYSLDGAQYTLLRLAYLTVDPTMQVGVMCASPDGEGFSVVFEEFRIQPSAA